MKKLILMLTLAATTSLVIANEENRGITETALDLAAALSEVEAAEEKLNKEIGEAYDAEFALWDAQNKVEQLEAQLEADVANLNPTLITQSTEEVIG